MASKNIIAELNKGDKLNENNYDIWHKKVQYLLNEQELLDHLTNIMATPEARNMAQYRCYQDAYANWFKRDKSVPFTLLSFMHDDLVGEFEKFPTTKKCGVNYA